MPSQPAVYAPFHALPSGWPRPLRAIRLWLLASFFTLTCSNLVQAQFARSLVFSTGGAVALRNDQTGALTPVAGSPFLTNGSTITLDAKARFLFTPGANSIHMFQITDSTTGAYQEVPNSPFASPDTNGPFFLAVEPTGAFLAVVNRFSQFPGQSSIETFQIQTNPPALIPVVGSLEQLGSVVLGASQPPTLRNFQLYLGPSFPMNINAPSGEEFDSVSIDPQTGFLLGISGSPDSSTARGYASDPQGRFVVLAHGQFIGRIDVLGIDGAFPNLGLALPTGVFPSDLWVDSTGSFVYALYDTQPNVVHILSIDPQANILAETASSPLPGFVSLPTFSTNPTSPFVYGGDLQPDLIHAFTTDPLTGYFIEAQGSPYSVPGGQGTLTFSIPQGQQGVSGPVIAISANALSFASLQVGSASSPQMLTITSTGVQALTISSIQLTGADPTEFLVSDTCHAPTVLQQNNFCTVSVTFAPNSSGPAQAAIVVTDDAPASPQSVSLSGNATAPPPPAPVAAILPNPVSFSTIPQGATSAAVNITIKNSGNATLHITSVAVAGNNPSDFTNPPNNCVGSFAPNSSCSISVTFAPLAAGLRSETITLSDDASDSPQIINVSGNATPAASVSPASSGSTSATVAPGGTATFNLQLSPDPSFTGTINFTCTGLPAAATCQAPALAVSQNSAMPFTVSVKTTGAAFAIPRLQPPAAPFSLGRSLPPFVLLLFLWTVFLRARAHQFLPRFGRATFASLMCLVLIAAAGCGGGGYSQTVPPPPLITTPQGVSAITLTPTAVNSSNKQLPLQPIQLQLTVN